MNETLSKKEHLKYAIDAAVGIYENIATLQSTINELTSKILMCPYAKDEEFEYIHYLLMLTYKHLLAVSGQHSKLQKQAYNLSAMKE